MVALAPSARSVLARKRSHAARELLANCCLCAHHCGVNRLIGPAGKCRAGAHARVFSAQVEVADERELLPTFAVAFGGCDLRCDFCITGKESWSARAEGPPDLAAVAVKATNALNKGARTVMILGGEPTIHLPDALEFLSYLPESAIVAWKTNSHGSAQSRELLAGLFNYWVADFKFGDDSCARRLAGVGDYLESVRANLLWAASDSELIVRHLVMPGHVDCCWRPVAEWLARELPGVKVSLRAGFWPAWRAKTHQELRNSTSSAEDRLARTIAREFDLNLIQ